MNLLRDANLQLRSQVFDLNQDLLDLLEIVESQKNRRMVSHMSNKPLRIGGTGTARQFRAALGWPVAKSNTTADFERNMMFLARSPPCLLPEIA